MTIDHIKHTIAPSLLPAIILCLQACTVANLDLCMNEHPHKGQLIMEYDWSGVAGEHPDSMVVVALRPLFRDKVAANWASDAAGTEDRLFGRLIASANGEEDLYRATYKDHPSRDSLFLPVGEWKISSYTSTPTAIGQAEKYVADVQEDGNALTFRLEESELPPVEFAYWHDRNPYGTWVDVSAKSALCMATGTLTVDEFANAKKNYHVKLTPRSLAQTVNVSFDTEVTDAGLTVDSMVCAVSGIAGAQNITTMELDVHTAHRAIFKATISAPANGRIRAAATLHVPGLVAGSTPAERQGPGILDVSVFTHFTDDTGIRRERRLDASVNLCRLLTATPSIRYDGEGRALQARPMLNLHIDGRMLVSREGLANAGNARDTWTYEGAADAAMGSGAYRQRD